jgi:hypothetical protein
VKRVLHTPDAVRERCHAALALAEADALSHFIVDIARMSDVAEYVAAVIRENYPDLVIPYHSRWRHFEASGVDRWRRLADTLQCRGAEAVARLRIELCTVSVLLDAGAGPDWRFREPDTGLVLSRSEGLAAASLHAFRHGLFSDDPAQPLRADAGGLSRLSNGALAQAFQVSSGNRLAGIAGRAALLRSLGAVARTLPGGRVGGLLDIWRSRLHDGVLPARELLITILEVLAPIWPGSGDVWDHPLLGLVPFHKLSQWLGYSLIEVLEEASIPVAGLDALTGLAEYRNGGLFLDMGVLRLRDPLLAAAPLPAAHPAVVEWRALTVALLDRLAPMLRARLGAPHLPLACLLQGGTWDAGRRLARERRPDGAPPLVVLSDGTVF